MFDALDAKQATGTYEMIKRETLELLRARTYVTTLPSYTHDGYSYQVGYIG